MRILYITYDGLLDPLGRSQIIPYLKDIAVANGGVLVLSFEKDERQFSDGQVMSQLMAQYGINWHPLRFTTKIGAAGKVWDLLKMYFWGYRLALRHDVRIIHTRGHPATQIGLFIKWLTGARLIFDFRGLWVDERVDKGGWDLKHWSHRWQYTYFKRTERKLLANADQLVVLSKAVVPEVHRLGASQATTVTVIPCCADFEFFPLANRYSRAQSRRQLEIPQDALVLGYLGSVGRMYMLNRLFRLFELAAVHRPEIHLLVVTQDIEALKNLMDKYLPVVLQHRVCVRSAIREQVPHMIAAMDVLVSFIQPSYARIAASPTKLAECFAVGIPVICNTGVGDVSDQVRYLKAGCIVDPKSDAELLAIVENIDEIITMGGSRLRESARKIFGLEVAQMLYRKVYKELN